MPDQPKPHAYMVTLVFGNGPISQTALVALDFPNAVALCGFIAGRDPNITGDLTGCAALELTPEWLRRSLRMLEDGKSTGEVVSLVSDNGPSLRDGMRISDPGGPLDGMVISGLGDILPCCPSHTWLALRAGVCPLCQPTLGGAA
jgi:hypothetical protein